MTAIFRKGDRVRHVSRTEWGVGAVLRDQGSRYVDILFENVGAKTFDLNLPGAAFARIEPSIETTFLDALVKHHVESMSKPAAKKGVAPKVTVQPWSTLTGCFLSYFPGGFQDASYLQPHGERGDKAAASAMMNESLDEPSLREMLRRGDHEGVCMRARKVVHRSKLLHTFENIALANALGSADSRQRFAESLNELLYGSGNEEARFESFARMLETIGAAGWPVATLFPFLRYPDGAMCLRPMLTMRAADSIGLALNYKSDLNLVTWRCMNELAQRVREKLVADGRPELTPRDMIDVQSFLWVSDPAYTA